MLSNLINAGVGLVKNAAMAGIASTIGGLKLDVALQRDPIGAMRMVLTAINGLLLKEANNETIGLNFARRAIASIDAMKLHRRQDVFPVVVTKDFWDALDLLPGIVARLLHDDSEKAAMTAKFVSAVRSNPKLHLPGLIIFLRGSLIPALEASENLREFSETYGAMQMGVLDSILTDQPES